MSFETKPKTDAELVTIEISPDTKTHVEYASLVPAVDIWYKDIDYKIMLTDKQVSI